MSNMHTEIKIKIIKFLEIAYQTDGKLTTALVKDTGPVTLSVDNTGKATLSGKAGIVSFSVDKEIKQYGLKFKYASVMFSGNRQGMVNYRASFGVPIEITIMGFIDVENLILNCSGLLCRATRALRNHYQLIDKSIAEQTQ